MRFLPHIGRIVPYERGAPAELVGRPGWARVSVGTRAEIDFFLDKLSAMGAGG